MEMLIPALSLVIFLGFARSIFCYATTTEKLDLSIFDDLWPSTKRQTLNTPALRPFAQPESTPFVGNSQYLSPFYRSDTSHYASSLPLSHGLDHPSPHPLMPSNSVSSASLAPFFTDGYLSYSPLMPPKGPPPAEVVSQSPHQGHSQNKIPAANGLPSSLYSLLPPVSLSPLPLHQGNFYNPSTPFISNVPQSFISVQGLQPLDSIATNHFIPPNGYATSNPLASFSLRIDNPYSQPVTPSASYSTPAFKPIVASFIRSYDFPLVPLDPSLLSVDDASSPVNNYLSSPPLAPSQSGVTHLQSPFDSTAAKTYTLFSMQPNTYTVPSYVSPVMSNPYNPFSMSYPGSQASSTNNLPSSFSNYP